MEDRIRIKKRQRHAVFFDVNWHMAARDIEKGGKTMKQTNHRT
ncbi:hypothetical protein ACIQAS_00600 [Bacillus safensis]